MLRANTLRIEIPRMSFGIAEGSLSMFFKAADGVGKPCEIAAIKFPARFSPSDALRFYCLGEWLYRIEFVPIFN